MHEKNIVNIFLLLSQKTNFQEYMPFYFLPGEATRDVKLVFYKLFTSYLNRRTHSLFDIDFSFRTVLNNCTEIGMNRYTDLFQTYQKQRSRSKGTVSESVRPEDGQAIKETCKEIRLLQKWQINSLPHCSLQNMSGNVLHQSCSLWQTNLRNCVKLKCQ